MEQEDPEVSRSSSVGRSKLYLEEEGKVFVDSGKDAIGERNFFLDIDPSPFKSSRFTHSKLQQNSAGKLSRKIHCIQKRVPRKRAVSVSRKKSGDSEGSSKGSSKESLDLSSTDFSDGESDFQFSEFEDGMEHSKRKKYFTIPESQYNVLRSDMEPPNKQERMEFKNWLNTTILCSTKSEAINYQEEEKSIRMVIFLNFFRLEIPSVEIVRENIQTNPNWLSQKRYTMERYVSYLKIPLTKDQRHNWWFDEELPSPIPSGEYGHLFVCHKLQTFSQTYLATKKEKRKAEKRKLTISLLKDEPISVFENPASSLSRSRARHIRWIIHWVTGSKKRVPHHLRVSSARLLASLAWPVEKIPGLRAQLWSCSAARIIIALARTNEIILHHLIDYETVTLGRLIGKGSVGMVYSSEKDEKPVAVKVSKESGIAFSKGEFCFEVALICALDHPNIIPCLGACTVSPSFFFISPLQGRGNLRMVLSDPVVALSWLTRIAIATDIAKGLAYLHSKKIIHRDIKSENILVGYMWDVQIIDFGSATFFDKYTEKRELDNMIGTPEWMAPEMIEDGKLYSLKVDMYSFGILLYEIFTRNHPYYELKQRYEILDSVLAGNRPSYLESDIPNKTLRSLMISCWNKLPRKRPSWAEILEKLAATSRTEERQVQRQL